MPNMADDIAELIVSVVVVEDAVHGVMGGGDRGVAGDRGHLSLGLDVSSVGGACLGEGIPKRSGVGPSYEAPDRTSCLKAVTGPLENANRGERGVFGLDRPGEFKGVMRAGSW